MTKKAVDYYEGYREADGQYVAVKGIDYDWHYEKVTVNLYVLVYDSEVAHDWVATDKVIEVSIDYFKKNYKYAGTTYLY